jgi:hypothetical protein
MVGPALTQSYANIVKGNHTENRGKRSIESERRKQLAPLTLKK